MKIMFGEDEIIKAIFEYIRNQGISLKGMKKKVILEHSGGRKLDNKTYSATVVLEPEEPLTEEELGAQPATPEKVFE